MGSLLAADAAAPNVLVTGLPTSTARAGGAIAARRAGERMYV
jgi:hypothetical protein